MLPVFEGGSNQPFIPVDPSLAFEDAFEIGKVVLQESCRVTHAAVVELCPGARLVFDTYMIEVWILGLGLE